MEEIARNENVAATPRPESVVVEGDQERSAAPPSNSASAAAPPPADPAEPDARLGASRDEVPGGNAAAHALSSAQAAAVERVLSASMASTANGGSNIPGWEAAKQQVMSTMATSDQFAQHVTPQSYSTPMRGGRGGRGASFAANGTADADEVVIVKAEDGSQTMPRATRGRPRGRGRGGGRPRGRGRGAGRGGKRKRDDDDEDGGGDSDSSDEVTAIATITKSGRSIQKPTTFVPPPPSPTTGKKKRAYNRRNPESAVCKACLRGTSPTSNMIVFCDGCNAPYHRYCHHPPIEQAVVDEVDREWFCKQCESERVVPAPESEVADFVSIEGVSAEQRQRYFSNLPPGVLVTLLTKATTLKPDLPVFAPHFKTKLENTNASSATASGNGQATATAAPTNQMPPPQPILNNPVAAVVDPDEKYTSDVHPPNYPRPGQGLMRTLPPEQEDQWLVEDDDKYGVFTHVYQPRLSAGKAAVTEDDQMT